MKFPQSLIFLGQTARLAVVASSLVSCLLVLGACTNDADKHVDNNAMLPEDQRVSSVPWNRPEGWEQRTSLGSLGNDPRFSSGNNR